MMLDHPALLGSACDFMGLLHVYLRSGDTQSGRTLPKDMGLVMESLHVWRLSWVFRAFIYQNACHVDSLPN
jgi:hypothetical protein